MDESGLWKEEVVIPLRGQSYKGRSNPFQTHRPLCSSELEKVMTVPPKSFTKTWESFLRR